MCISIDSLYMNGCLYFSIRFVRGQTDALGFHSAWAYRILMEYVSHHVNVLICSIKVIAPISGVLEPDWIISNNNNKNI